MHTIDMTNNDTILKTNGIYQSEIDNAKEEMQNDFKLKENIKTVEQRRKDFLKDMEAPKDTENKKQQEEVDKIVEDTRKGIAQDVAQMRSERDDDQEVK